MDLLLKIFEFEGQEVRFVGTAENPEWIAEDICRILGIKSHRSATRNFDSDQKGAHTLITPGGKQKVITVFESGLYELIFSSNKPNAIAFKKWVFSELLPKIRKEFTDVIEKRTTKNFLLATPKKWSKVFSDDFYNQMSRLSGYSWNKKTHHRPACFRGYTAKLVYNHLDPELLKILRATHQNHKNELYKIHQFLTPDLTENLIQHLKNVTAIMKSASSIKEAIRLVNQACTENYQLQLFK